MEEEKEDHVKLHHEGVTKIDGAVYQLEALSDSLYHIGNEALSKKLIIIVNNLNTARDNFEDAYNKLFYQWYSESNQHTANLVNAAINAVKGEKR